MTANRREYKTAGSWSSRESQNVPTLVSVQNSVTLTLERSPQIPYAPMPTVVSGEAHRNTATVSRQRSGSLSPVRRARSSIRDSTSHNRQRTEEGEGDDGLRRRDWLERGSRSHRSLDYLQHHRDRPHMPDNNRDLDTESIMPGSSSGLERHNPDIVSDSSFEHNDRQSTRSAPEDEDGSSRFEAHQLRRMSSVDHGLLGVGGSLRSSWSTPVLPPMPNGEAVPILLSHLAELRSVCKRQRSSGRSIRSALVRKQGELDETSAEAARLRAELGFIVGDMLGSLQRNPTAAAIFGALSGRIRSDLGAEEAAVYVDVGGGKLWLVSSHGDDDKAEFFIQKGIGIVGLAAMGAIPDAATVTPGKGSAVVDGDGVDVLLLNDGLEAFDNGTTVEAALLRSARRRRSRDGSDGCSSGAASTMAGAVKNMLLARVGPGAESQERGASFFPPGVKDASNLPGPPTAVIQALNKQMAPERFTEGDARAVRKLAPSVVAGSRLILSLMTLSSESGAVTCEEGNIDKDSSLGRRVRGGSRSAEEWLLLETLRRARDGVGADRGTIFVLHSANDDEGELRLWYEEPPISRAGSTGLACNRAEGGYSVASREGLQGLALATGRAVRSEDALSDARYDREPDLSSGFLARSVLCVPLLARPRVIDHSEPNNHSSWRAPLGMLQLSLGRGVCQRDINSLNSGRNKDSRVHHGESDRKKTFVKADEPIAEAFGEQIAGLLTGLLDAGFKPSASVASLVGGGGQFNAGPDPPAWAPNGDAVDDSQRTTDKEEEIARTPIRGDGASDGVLQQSRISVDPIITGVGGSNDQESVRDGNSVVGARALKSSTRGSQTKVTGAANLGGGGGALCSSTTSTVASSPLVAGVQASVSTFTGQMAPSQPPSPATDCSNGSSPDRLSSQAGPTSPVVSVEATQGRSWASAHRVLEACKEGLAASRRVSLEREGIRRARQSSDRDSDGKCSTSSRHTSVAGSQNAESLTPAVCSLVSSLLPDCSTVLLLLEAGTSRLRAAGCGGTAVTGGVIDDEDDQRLLPRTPQPLRREDVARRALASGKALLAQASEEGDREKRAAGHRRVKKSGVDGERVFCIPVRGSANVIFGVLQVFLPPPPLSSSPTSLSPSSPVDLGKSTTSPRVVVTPPPPPSFFMATKIVADCLGLALGWCDALDRAEADRDAQARDSAANAGAAAVASMEAHERSRRELQMEHQRELRAAEETHVVRVAEVADSHARDLMILLENKESLANAAAEASARARNKRDAARALVAWREVINRTQRADKNNELMDLRRRARAFRVWVHCAMAIKKAKALARMAASWRGRRGLRRTFGIWERAAARGRWVKERRLAGARLVVEVLRRYGPVKRRFTGWRAAPRASSSEQQALSLKSAEDLLEARADEDVARVEARAQLMADRVADLSWRRRQDRASRTAFGLWRGMAWELGRQRESSAVADQWRQRRLVTAALSRWRCSASPSRESATSIFFPEGARNCHQLPQSERTKGSTEGETWSRNDSFRSTELVEAKSLGSPQQQTRTTTADDRGDQYCRRDLEEGLQRLAETAAVAFCRQKERLSILQTLVAWRRVAATERSRRDALSRLAKRRYRNHLSGSFGRWRAGILAVRVAAERQREEEALAAARTMGEEAARTWWLNKRLKRDRDDMVDLLPRIEMVAERDAGEETTQREHRLQHARGTAYKIVCESSGAQSYPVAAVAAAMAAESAAGVVTEAAMKEMVAEAAEFTRERTRDMRTIAELQETVEALQAQAKTGATDAAEAEVAKAAAEEEVKRDRDTLVELQNAVEALQAETSESALRQKVADAQLLERGARVSGLALAVAQAFRHGRERVSALRALTTLKDAARFRRLSATATARIAAIRCARYVRHWKDAAERARLRSVASCRAAAFAEDFAACATLDDMRKVLRKWAESSRARRSALVAAEALRARGQRAALRALKLRCRERKNAAANYSRIITCFRESRTRRGLRRWFEVACGGGRGRDEEDGKTGSGRGGSSVIVRLMKVAARVEQAGSRRRARKVLRQWSARAKDARRRGEFESQTSEALMRGNMTIALLRWRGVILLRRRLRRALHRGASWDALSGLSSGWSIWRDNVQLAKERRASLLPNTVQTATGRVPSNLSPTHGLGMSNPTREALRDDPKFVPPSEQQHLRQSNGNMSDVGESGSNRGLLDLLVDVCAAPPPYPLGSGVQSLGRDACRAAVRAFNLLSASLFEVVSSNPEAVAVRVAAVQRVESRDDPPAAVAADGGVPERERLGEGTIGVAAQSARLVCIEVAPSSSTGSGLDGPMPTWSNTPSTVLCVPVMLQAASAPNIQVGSAGDSGVNANRMDSERSPQLFPGVEVVGVLRAVRTGAGGFAGDDARVLSVFCGQLALAMVAERKLRDSRAGVEAKAAKEARAVRRNACRRVGALFAEGAVARALLRQPSHGALEETEVASRRMRRVAEELWRSVAGLAAGALGCERVDLLRVGPLAGGGMSCGKGSGGSLPEFLSQEPLSRSFRKHSRKALLAAKPSSRSVLSSRDGEGGGVSLGEARSWLYVPVPGAGGQSGDSVVDASDGSRQRQESRAMMVCCAINKESARKFDDVDEALLSTIAALYAVAASWLSPAMHSEDSSDATSPTQDRDRVARRSPANSKDSHGIDSSARGELSGATSEHSAQSPNVLLEALRTTPVDTRHRSGETVLLDAAISPGAPGVLPPRGKCSGSDNTGTAGVRRTGSWMSAISSDADVRGHISRGVRPPTSDMDTASAVVNARNREKTTGSSNDHKSVATSTAEGLNVGRAMSPACPGREGRRNSGALPEGPDIAAKENIELRKRAERAERMLETTRERLRRALEDGATDAAAVQANVDTAVDRAEDCNGGVGHEGEKVSTSGVERGRNYSRRRKSAHRSVPATVGTMAKISSRNVKDRSKEIREDSSYSDACEGQRRYYSDDNGKGGLRRQTQYGQDVEPTEHARNKSRRNRRRHSVAPKSSSSGDGAGADNREVFGKGKEDVDSHPREKRERRGRVELRASDLTRMRKIIARLKITTAQLQAERSIGSRARGEEDNSEALARENTILRRKLFGLVMLEELEERAMEKDLLPLTGGGLPGGDFFQPKTIE